MLTSPVGVSQSSGCGLNETGTHWIEGTVEERFRVESLKENNSHTLHSQSSHTGRREDIRIHVRNLDPSIPDWLKSWLSNLVYRISIMKSRLSNLDFQISTFESRLSNLDFRISTFNNCSKSWYLNSRHSKSRLFSYGIMFLVSFLVSSLVSFGQTWSVGWTF